MPYAPGQPWDKTLSYTFGQTCTYNGLPYFWFSGTTGSTVNVPPNEDEVPFQALDGLGNSDTRNERGWILMDGSTYSGYTYGSPEKVSKEIRKLPTFPANIWFEQPQGIKYWSSSQFVQWTDSYGKIHFDFINNKIETTWAFYGSAVGMSKDYGLINVTPHGTKAQDSGDPFVGTYSFTMPDQLGFSPPGWLDKIEGGNFIIETYWPVPNAAQVLRGGADTAASAMWFSRTANYTVYAVFYDSNNDIISISSQSGSITNGPVRDSAVTSPSYGPTHTFSIPEDAVSIVGYMNITSFTPNLSN